ncbi:DEAD/DEAH box helicase [candidate division WWE3 bacterium]|nr:DEAD/DEAH box helicase [candidate division WWE3 bacterium]
MMNAYKTTQNRSYSSSNGASSSGTSFNRSSSQGQRSGGFSPRGGSSRSGTGPRNFAPRRSGGGYSGGNSYGSRSGYGSRGGYGSNSRSPRGRRSFSWSISDLIKSIEFSKRPRPVSSEEAYTNEFNFVDFPIVDILKRNIVTKGFKTPSPIQDKAIPAILAGEDLIGIANTGTGKTAAFLIPLVNKVFKDKTQKVLIIAPTRELAEQIETEFRYLSAGMGIYSALIIGGKSMYAQKLGLNRRPNFIISTPGRLNDHVERGNIDLGTFNNVVLDETDRMVDIGFLQDIKRFIAQLPKERQSLFFSATVSNKVQEILQAFVQAPVTISVKKQETGENIKQEIVRVQGGLKKIDVLHDLLITNGFDKVLIFANTKWGVQKLSDELVKRGFKADAIHGDKRQGQRHQTLQKFRNDEIKILLATDVASRGLDINNVSHVINYELPASYDEYVHRIGRTGRADKKGTALTFMEE